MLLGCVADVLGMFEGCGGDDLSMFYISVDNSKVVEQISQRCWICFAFLNSRKDQEPVPAVSEIYLFGNPYFNYHIFKLRILCTIRGQDMLWDYLAAELWLYIVLVFPFVECYTIQPRLLTFTESFVVLLRTAPHLVESWRKWRAKPSRHQSGQGWAA